MKRWIALAIIVISGIAALAWSERHPVEVRVSPAALLYFIADTEWELSRMPVALTRLSDQQEIDAGNRLARAYSLDDLRNLPPERRQHAQIVAAYVTRVGSRVAAHAHRKLPYKFHYVPDTNFVNAFALPGGHVYIGAGLIELMDTEDELASVLGHEIEHIDHYHCAERVQLEARLRRIPLGELLAIPAMVFEAGYNKDQELEADREGTRLAVWASYSPLGAIRMFETFNRLYREYVRHATSPQDELSAVAIEALGGYFRSHPPPSERIAQIRKMISDENWTRLNPERDLEVAYILWSERAQRAYEAGHYEVAVRTAQRSLALDPNQPFTLEVLGRSEFALADFPAAAAAFRKAIDQRAVKDDGLIEAYGDALAAQRAPAAALREFSGWIAEHPNWTTVPAVRLELARLTLLARDKAAADSVLFPALWPNAAAMAPELRGRYGWWFYEAGQFDSAEAWLQGAVQELPGDQLLQLRLAWAQVEQRNLESAIQRFHNVIYQNPSSVDGDWKRRARTVNEAHMGLAVAYWQSHLIDNAKSEFSTGALPVPEWLNPKWVGALYSPGVAKTVEELKAARAQRRTQ